VKHEFICSCWLSLPDDRLESLGWSGLKAGTTMQPAFAADTTSYTIEVGCSDTFERSDELRAPKFAVAFDFARVLASIRSHVTRASRASMAAKWQLYLPVLRTLDRFPFLPTARLWLAICQWYA